MKTIYIAHPIGGDVQNNIKKVIQICSEVHDKNIIPIVPYLVSLQYLDDEVHEDRRLGADANLEHFHRRFIDEVWLYGDRISNGMKEEILLALQLGIPVIPKTEGTTRDFQEFQK